MDALTRKNPDFTAVRILSFINDVKVGRCLHSTALVSLVMLFPYLCRAIDAYCAGKIYWGFFFLILSVCSVTIFLFAELDAYSRFQNYKMIRDLIFHHGFQGRIIRNFSHSKCQREAAYFAASDLGFKREIKEYFRESGYRWYHVFPDFLWKHPDYLLSKYFWLTTFFTKSYTSKYLNFC